MMDTPLPDQPPRRIGRYEIVEELGKGGMGVVYKAQDPVLGRFVALKVGRLERSAAPADSDTDQRTHFMREARLAAQFIHPNIVITYDAGFEAEEFYMALEYIEGTGLHKHSRPADLLPRVQVLEVVYNVCYALDHIHSQGIAHLDLKPANIMLTTKGQVKLMDFGIARFLKDQAAAGGFMGTVYYMSPEQVSEGAQLDPRSDIYSLGVVLYELLAGRRPFTGENDYQVIYAILNKPAPSLAEVVPELSTDLAAIVKKAMHRRPQLRFKTAREFADALLPLIKGQDSSPLARQDKLKIDYLKRLVFFTHFQHADLLEVLRISTWSHHPRHTRIIEESRLDNNIYIIVQGRASLALHGDTKEFGPGDCFGDTAICYSMPRHFKIQAETDCVVMTINANLLNQASASLQVKFLREFYKVKTMQLVELNLRRIQSRI